MSVAKIDNIVPSNDSGQGATLIGTYTGSATIDVSSYLKSGDTVNNFIVELVSGAQTNSGSTDGNPRISMGVTVSGWTLSKSLSGNSLSVSGMGDTVYLNTNQWGNIDGRSRSFTWRLYHV